jgi:hypothetical protein
MENDSLRFFPPSRAALRGEAIPRRTAGICPVTPGLLQPSGIAMKKSEKFKLEASWYYTQIVLVEETDGGRWVDIKF